MLRQVAPFIFLITALVWLTTPLHAQDQTRSVAIKPLVPFVVFHDDGTYSGFSIDLIVEIARKNNWQIEWLPYETVGEVLDAVANRQADIGIAGISITAEREEFVDFSQPMFNAGLQIMTRVGGDNPGLSLLLSLLDPSLLLIPLVLGIVVVIMGHIIWLVERKNPDFPDEYLPGIGEGMWWAASSVLGAGDKMPRSTIGRISAIVWVIIGIVMISLLTANLTAENTISQLQSNIRGIDDLPGRTIATVSGTTSADWLQDQRLRFRPVDRIEDAFELLLSNEIDVIVYDSPVLLYFATTEGRGRVSLTGSVFARQDYGIAVPSGSTTREAIDRALLSMLEDGTYDDLYTRYFGQ